MLKDAARQKKKKIIVIMITILLVTHILIGLITAIQKADYINKLIDDGFTISASKLQYGIIGISAIFWSVFLIFMWIHFQKQIEKKWPYIVVLIFSSFGVISVAFTLLVRKYLLSNFGDFTLLGKAEIKNVWSNYNFTLLYYCSLFIMMGVFATSIIGIINNNGASSQQFHEQPPQYSQEEIDEHSNEPR